jgi:hypothetical protein
MNLTNLTSKRDGDLLKSGPDVHWSSHVAAASLVAGAVLLLTGRKREALIVAGAGAATTLLERPEAAQELWSQLPGYVRSGQDFLVKAEQVIERVGEQAAKVREAFLKER